MKNNLSRVILFFCFFLFVFAFRTFSGVNSITVLATTNGVLLAPTNIFPANIAALTNALNSAGYSAGGGGAGGLATNVYLQNGGTNLVIITNSPGNWTINTGTNVLLNGSFTGNFLGYGGGVTGIYSSSIVGTVAGALLANTASYATNAGSATNITGATGSGLNVAGNFSGNFGGSGALLVGIPGSSIESGVLLATNAQNATNIYGAGLLTMTNASLTVFTNSIALNNAYNGSFSGTGTGLTNLSAFNLSGQLLLQNGVSLTIQTNPSTNPFDNTNWAVVNMYPGQGDPWGNGNNTTPWALTNDPYIQIFCGYPQSKQVFGGPLGVSPFVDTNSINYLPQGPELRMKISFFGNKLAFYTDAANEAWYRSDNSVWTPFSIQIINGSDVNYFLQFNWGNFGFHEFEMHFYGGSILAAYWPATNTLILPPKPGLTGIIIGDSVTDGSISWGEDGYPAKLADLLMPYGINIIPQGEGGTGYIATNSPNLALPFYLRLTNCIIPFSPNFIIWAGGVNDPSNGLFSAATNCYGIIKNSLPNCKQLVVGPWAVGPGHSGPLTEGINIPISNAASSFGLPVIYPQWNSNSEWITPENYSFFLNTSDAVHPSPPGCTYYAHQLANFVLTNLLTNATPILW